MKRKQVIIAGGSGFIGSLLTRHLTDAGYGVTVLTRSAANVREGNQVRFLHWDGQTLGPWLESLDGADAIVNLTGRSVNCRYHARNRREIQRSRVDSVNVLAQAVARCAHPPRVWVQAATLAIYGHAGETVLDESATPATGFSPDTALMWENAFIEARLPSQLRRVILRISFVLGRGGGPLATLEHLARWFLGGAVASGRQYVSWIHWFDLCEMFRWAIERDDMSGMYHATSPNPVTNAEFMRELRRAVHRPWSPPAPRWAVQVGSWLMRTEAELALRGRFGIPKRFAQLGFAFRFPKLREAMDDLYWSDPKHERHLITASPSRVCVTRRPRIEWPRTVRSASSLRSDSGLGLPFRAASLICRCACLFDRNARQYERSANRAILQTVLRDDHAAGIEESHEPRTRTGRDGGRRV